MTRIDSGAPARGSVTDERRAGPPGWLAPALAALSAVVAAALGLGVGELVAALVRPEASPVVIVANRFILATPEGLKRWAIGQFGTDDKLALGSGIFLGIALFAAGIGLSARHRRGLGAAGMALFGMIGCYCALTTHAHRDADVIPVVFAAATAVVTVELLVHRLAAALETCNDVNASRVEAGRRRFLWTALIGSGGALLTAIVGRSWQHSRFDAARARAAVVVPPPAAPALPLPRGADLGKSPVPFATPNRDFYRIDTAFSIPQIDPSTWKLTVKGMVGRTATFTFADLLARPLVERWITMTCVSNEVGGTLIGTALFRGVLLAPLLRELGLDPGADQLVCRSVDGMTIGAPVAQVMDGRDAMLAVGMNGVALPVAHGFPVRMVVPGLYGYVSACKWINEIDVTTFTAYDAYWVVQGWDAQLPVQLASRIDTPRSGAKVQVGSTVAVAGVAWHQHVGVGRVQVQIDDGPWIDARLGAVPSSDTWRQWVVPWTVTSAGNHRLTVRAFDAHGTPQSTAAHHPFPGASSGLHHVSVYGTA